MYEKQLKKFQVFTPRNIIDNMLDMLNYRGSFILDKSFLENSFGNGEILIKAIKRYIYIGNENKISKEKISENLEKLFWGYEIDENLYDEAISSLDELLIINDLPNVNWNLYNEDYLRDDTGRSFDFIVGNPPYIKYQELEVPTRKFLKESFDSCKKGKYDYCYPFIEKSIDSLSSTGWLVYLVPSSIFKNVFAEKLREIMKDSLAEIIDYSGSKLFPKATTASTIILFKKGIESNYVKYVDDQGTMLIEKKSLNTKKWVFKELHNINSGDRKFGDYFRVQNGIATLKNSVFIHKYSEMNDFIILEGGEVIEKMSTLNAYSAKSVSSKRPEKIIFPYKLYNNLTEHFTEDEFKTKYPLTYQYLLSKKELLGRRKSDKSAQWFEFGRSQGLANVLKNKLLMSSVLTKNITLTA